MTRRLLRFLLLSTLLAVAATTLHAGGWSIITLSEFPDQAVSAEPLTLTFAVRQHGHKLVDGLKPTIRASMAGGSSFDTAAVPAGEPARYTATLRFPKAGEWTIRVDGGFNPEDKTRMGNSVVLPLLRVVRHASESHSTFTDADRGGRLFVAKGCVGCHQASGDRDLANKRFKANYLKAFLADPSIRTTDMPNLELTEKEIEALVAFINRAPSVHPVAGLRSE